MPAVVVTASERSTLEASMPTAAAIRSAFTRYTPRTNPVLGAWIGPGPRVTRTASVPAFVTTAAWLYGWPDTAYTSQNWSDLQERVRSAVADGLAEISSDWSAVTLLPYNPAVHGAVSWWSSGAAAVTQSRDTPPTGVGRLGVPDNPLGPTTSATHPPTAGDLLRGGGGWLLGLGGAALLGYGLVLVAQSRRRA
jgi:hypothetical protein